MASDTLRTLRVELTAGTGGFEKGFAQASAAVQSLGDKFKALDKSLDGGASKKIADFADTIGSRLQGVGMALSASLTLPITALGGLAIKAAGDFQQIEIAFTTMLGSAEKAKAFLSEMEAFAARTPFQFPDLVDAAKRMLALGFTAEQIIPTLTAIGDAVAGLGGGKDVIDGVTLALGQMSSKGKVSAQEMNQLAERGIPAWDILSRKIGVSIPEAMKMAEKGAISAAVAVPAILQGMSEKFGGMMALQSKTLLGQWSTLKDELGFMLRDIGTALLPLATSMVEAFNSALPYLKAAVQAFSELSPPIQTVIIAVGAFAAALGPALLALGGLSMALGAVIAAGPILLPILAAVAGAALVIGTAFVASGGSMEAFIVGLGELQAVAMEAVSGVAQAAKWLMDVMGKLPGAMGQPYRDASAALTEFSLNMDGAAQSVRVKADQIAMGFTGAKEELKKAADNVAALKSAFATGTPTTGLAGLSKEAKQAAKDAEALEKTLLAADKAFHGEAMKTWDEWGKRADENIKNITSEYLRISELLGPTTGEIEAQFKDLQASAAQRGGLFQLNDAELTKFISEMERLGDTGKLTGDQWGVLGDAYTEAMERGLMGTDAAIQRTYDWGASLQTISQIAQAMPGTFGQVFGSIAAGISGIGATLKNAGGLGGLFKSFGGGFSGIMSGLAGVMSIGSAVVGVAKSIGKAFGIGGDPVIMEVNDMRDAFFEAQGGFVALQQKLSSLTNQDLVKRIFDAKTVDEFNAAVAEVNGLLGLQDQAQQALKEATDRYGFSIAELGPAMQRQELDTQAAQLLQDFKLLTASGIDTATVLGKMGPNFSTFVQQSIAAGQALPMAMKPMVDQLIASGQLLDANGNAFTSAEAAGLSFTETLTEGLSRAVTAIEALVAALTGVPPVHIPVTYGASPSGPPVTIPAGPEIPAEVAPAWTEQLPAFAAGGIGDFGRGALAVLHGREAIIPLDGGGAGGGLGPTINVYPSFEENPLQTYEARQQLREHTVRTLYREASRDLASAVAAGGA